MNAMKKRTLVLVLATIVALLVLAVTAVSADKPIKVDGAGNEIAWETSKQECTTIQDGLLKDSKGNLLVLGYDGFGYNYQAHMFNGRYCDYDRVIGGDYCDVSLIMKWNDAWLANVDCDSDGLLDRHFGFTSYIGSGAWVTNHQSGSYEDDNDGTCEWDYFVKIVAAPIDAVAIDGIWYTADDTEIGKVIWGAFAIIQQVENDPCAGIGGAQYVSPASPGFGFYKP
jgi:opacity protein-like surface antigen